MRTRLDKKKVGVVMNNENNNNNNSNIQKDDSNQKCGSNNNVGSMPANLIRSSPTPTIVDLIELKTKNFDVQTLDEEFPTKMSSISYQQNRILGRNLNGTIAMTTQPSNESELQLYRVLQRANLLAYYDTFICQGGDDVQQLYEAGEEEFLEIMQLIGMHTKPLHVRRLQKSLHEWATNPALFQSPLVAPFPSNSHSIQPPATTSGGNSNNKNNTIINSSSSNNNNNNNNNSSSIDTASRPALGSSHSSPHHPVSNSSPSSSLGLMQQTFTGNASTPSPNQFVQGLGDYNQPCSPNSMTPVLIESQIRKLTEATEALVKSMPPSFDLKPSLMINGNKKRINKDIENIMNMMDDDPRRMDEIRKFAAIYGRFDCKRRPEKPLTLHEVCVNEAAAQICSKVPSLLYRRDELFTLARQVVRDSGYQYSKGHSRSQSCRSFDDHSQSDSINGKRMRLESSPSQELKSSTSVHDEDRKRRYDRLEGIVDQLKSLGNKQEEIKNQIQQANERKNFQKANELQSELDLIENHQMQLVTEKSELEKQKLKEKSINQMSDVKTTGSEKADTEDTDSQFSLYSNESTPSMLNSSPNLSDLNISTTTTSENILAKSHAKSKKRPLEFSHSNSTTTTATNTSSNSNDSLDFSGTGKHPSISETFEESLRIVGQMINLEENLDLRALNKYTEALQRAPSVSNLNETTSLMTNHRSTKSEGLCRSRGTSVDNSGESSGSGKLSKNTDLSSTLYEQLLSQAQLQQQMQLYHQSIYAQALFNEINVPLGSNDGQTTLGINENGQNDKTNDETFGQSNLFSNSENKTKNETMENKNDIVQSLNALISIANTNLKNETSIKSDLTII